MEAPRSAASMVVENFRWRIEATSPTNDEERKGFRYVDPDRVSAVVTPGAVRTFQVLFVSSEQAHEVEHVISRWAYYVFDVVLAYPGEWPLSKRTRVALDDQADLLKALRSQSSWTGYSNSTSDTDIGLESREYVETSVDEQDETTFYRQRWRCLIRDTE